MDISLESKGVADMGMYLYIKQHSITGKLYFGKTMQEPETYLGSGVHWKRHIKKHGTEHVVTLWYCLFIDQRECANFALRVSEHYDIVDSDDWLNLKVEDGVTGKKEFTKHRVTPDYREFILLELLTRLPNIHSTEIIKLMDISQATFSRLIRGLGNKVTVTGVGRSTHYRLTE